MVKLIPGVIATLLAGVFLSNGVDMVKRQTRGPKRLGAGPPAVRKVLTPKDLIPQDTPLRIPDRWRHRGEPNR